MNRFASRTQSAAPPTCTNASQVEISCVRALYNTADYVPKNLNQGKVATTGYINEHAGYNDLAQFLRRQRPDQTNYRFQSVGVAGGTNNQDADWWKKIIGNGLEANLDTQLVAGIVGASGRNAPSGGEGI